MELLDIIKNLYQSVDELEKMEHLDWQMTESICNLKGEIEILEEIQIKIS